MRKRVFISFLLLLLGCDRTDYHLAGGDSGSFAQWSGHWVFINYWATWCAPCYEEVPDLNAFAKESNIKVFGVNFEKTKDQALQKDIEKMGIEFPVFVEDVSQALKYPQPSVLPATVVFNPQGQLHKILIGPQTQATLRAAMEKNQ